MGVRRVLACLLSGFIIGCLVSLIGVEFTKQSYKKLVAEKEARIAELEQHLTKCRKDVIILKEAKNCTDGGGVSWQKIEQSALQKAKKHVPVRFVKEIVSSAQQVSSEQRGVLLLALVTVESHFDPFARSRSGAVGCAQVIPKFWLEELKKAGIVKDYRDLFDPKLCVPIADYVLAQAEKHTNNITEALAIYQCGINNKRCWKKEGKTYASKILEQYAVYLLEGNK